MIILDFDSFSRLSPAIAHAWDEESGLTPGSDSVQNR